VRRLKLGTWIYACGNRWLHASTLEVMLSLAGSIAPQMIQTALFHSCPGRRSADGGSGWKGSNAEGSDALEGHDLIRAMPKAAGRDIFRSRVGSEDALRGDGPRRAHLTALSIRRWCGRSQLWQKRRRTSHSCWPRLIW
jgi:hypothetical protein